MEPNNDLIDKKLIEVVVCWQDRAINTYHFSDNRIITLGVDADVTVPEGSAPSNWPVLNLTHGAIINTNDDMRLEVASSSELVSNSKGSHELASSEICTIYLLNKIRLVIRFVPRPPPIIFDPSFMLNRAGRNAVVAAVLLSFLMCLYVWWSKPTYLNNKADIIREAKIIFTDLRPQSVTDSTANSATEDSSVKNSKSKAAKAKSNQLEIKKSGLLAAFGIGSAKNKLDKINSGSAQLIGAGEKADGDSGVKTNGQGDKINFKDTGAGGAGTAIQGISGIKTKGRSSGMGGYGSGASLGSKDSVHITAGGLEEEFVGTIDKEAVRRVVRSILTQFKSCYERQFRLNSNLEGKVVVKWEIHPNGIAKNAQILKAKSTINSSAVEECVKSKILGLKFPDPPAGVAAEVTYPFIFVPDKFTQGEEQ